MIKLSHIRAFVIVVLLGLSTLASAQVINPSTSVQNIYPTASSQILRPSTVSNYSLRNVTTGWGSADLYISGHSGGVSGFVWELTSPGAPNIVLSQGSFPYPNVMDMEVGLVDSNGTLTIYVAYYKIGSGHYMDIYNLTTSTLTPVVPSGVTMTLSNSTQYGRIRFDSHKLYGTAVVWCYPGIGIQTLVGNKGLWGNVITLTGTTQDSDPDVAFSHSNNQLLNVHFAYHNKTTGKITESVKDWPTLLAAPPSYIAPIIEDLNNVGSTATLRLVLDCPDHYDVENWAYTYSTDPTKIQVRFIDYHSSSSPVTKIVNNGSLGNVSMASTYKSYAPCLSYGDGTYGEFIQIGWYVKKNSGTYNAYVGIHVNEKVSTFFSTPDYYELPNSVNSLFYPLRPGIAYSKASDIGYSITPDFMYATFYDLLGSTTYRLHHAFHPWGIGTFKGTSQPQIHPECGHESNNNVMALANDPVKVFPNPFTDMVSTTFKVKEAGKVTLQLTDITGRVVDQTSSDVTAGTHSFTTSSLRAIPAGMYQLNIILNGKNVSQQKVVKH